MAPLTLPGSLNMLTALIDWRDETARCVGVFRADGAMALEVEYKVHMDTTVLDLLARAFLKAGVPVIRGSKAAVPMAHIPSVDPSKGVGAGDDGLIVTHEEKLEAKKKKVYVTTTKTDRRTRAYRLQQAEGREPALTGVPGGNNGSEHPTGEGRAQADVSR